MNSAPDQNASTELQSLCAANQAARRLFESFAQRQKDSRETNVERAASIAGVDYGSMLQVFKKLDQVGMGRFIPGRHGWPSRMEWKFSIRSLGKVAQGKGKKLEGVAPDAVNQDTAEEIPGKPTLLDHEFQLRADLKIKFSLPKDLSDKEADRVGAFLKTLPL